MNCPNSFYCYSTIDKPHFEPKKDNEMRGKTKHKLQFAGVAAIIVLTLASYIWAIISIIKAIF